MVDIVGYDKYNAADGMPNLSSISSTFYSLVQSTNGQKMVAMTENDTIPSLENLLKDKASWLYFCPWYMNYLTSEQNNPVDNLVEIYNSEYCITLDELPDLKSYPMASEEFTLGDINFDGKITTVDLTLLAKHLTKASSLGSKQLNAAELTGDNTVNVFDLIMLKRKLLA